MADSMVLKNSNIQPTVVFNFYRTANENMYSKDVLANSLDKLMGELLDRHTPQIFWVFSVLQRQRKKTSTKKSKCYNTLYTVQKDRQPINTFDLALM